MLINKNSHIIKFKKYFILNCGFQMKLALCSFQRLRPPPRVSIGFLLQQKVQVTYNRPYFLNFKVLSKLMEKVFVWIAKCTRIYSISSCLIQLKVYVAVIPVGVVRRLISAV